MKTTFVGIGIIFLILVLAGCGDQAMNPAQPMAEEDEISAAPAYFENWVYMVVEIQTIVTHSYCDPADFFELEPMFELDAQKHETGKFIETCRLIQYKGTFWFPYTLGQKLEFRNTKKYIHRELVRVSWTMYKLDGTVETGSFRKIISSREFFLEFPKNRQRTVRPKVSHGWLFLFKIICKYLCGDLFLKVVLF